MILTTCLVQSCPLPLILEGTWHLLPPSPIALWALGSSCMFSSTTLSLSAASCKGQTKKKEIWAKHTIQSPFKELFSLFTRNTSFFKAAGSLTRTRATATRATFLMDLETFSRGSEGSRAPLVRPQGVLASPQGPQEEDQDSCFHRRQLDRPLNLETSTLSCSVRSSISQPKNTNLELC